MAQQSSRVTVSVDGDQIRSKAGSSSMTMGGLTVDDGDVTSTDQGLTVYKEKYMPGKITTTLIHMADSDLNKLLTARGVTVTYVTDTKVTYTMANAVTTALGELKDGEIEVSFRGDQVRK